LWKNRFVENGFFRVWFDAISKVAFRYGKDEGVPNNWGVEFFSFYSEGLLRYTQITTKLVVIRAPAIPEMTHSAENMEGKLTTSQGHTVWKLMLAITPPRKPNRANIPIIFNLSPIRFTLLLTVKSSRF
jgi:hypothetical protein